MTAPDSSRADDRYQWIAGYVDGELDEATRQKVEDRLAIDPASGDDLRDQEQFSPANRELWDAVAPPELPSATWARLNDRVAAAVLPAARSGRRSTRWMARLSGLAAAVAIGWVGYEALTPPPAIPQSLAVLSDDPLADFAVLPIADRTDVEVVAIRGEHPNQLFAADDPLPDGLPLAGPGDVTVDAGEGPLAPGTIPMIFPRPR